MAPVTVRSIPDEVLTVLKKLAKETDCRWSSRSGRSCGTARSTG